MVKYSEPVEHFDPCDYGNQRTQCSPEINWEVVNLKHSHYDYEDVCRVLEEIEVIQYLSKVAWPISLHLHHFYINHVAGDTKVDKSI